MLGAGIGLVWRDMTSLRQTLDRSLKSLLKEGC